MSAGKRKVFRVTVIVAWLVWALIAVGTALAQDGNGTGAQPAVPGSVDEVAARLMPLLVGAALIERTIEFLFTWLERALLDASNSLHDLAARLSGLVEMDLRKSWKQFDQLTHAMIKRKAVTQSLEAGNAASPNPADWPLAKLQLQAAQAEKSLAQAKEVIGAALKSPEYVARKKMTAAVLSVVFGIMLALATNLRLFEPVGVDVSENFEGPFSTIDLVLAGILMGLGTDWVHQVIGLLIKGKGLLGRAAGGEEPSGINALLSDDDIKRMAELAIQKQLEERVKQVIGQAQDAVVGLVQPSKAEASEDDSPG